MSKKNLGIAILGDSQSGKSTICSSIMHIESANTSDEKSEVSKISKDMAKQSVLIAKGQEPSPGTSEKDESFQIEKNGYCYAFQILSPEKIEIEGRSFDKQKTNDHLKSYDIKIMCVNIFTIDVELSTIEILKLISKVQLMDENAKLFLTFKNIVYLTYHFDIDLLNHPAIVALKEYEDLLLKSEQNNNKIKFIFINKSSSSAVDTEENEYLLDGIFDVIKKIMRQKSYNQSAFKSIGELCQIVVLTHSDLVENPIIYFEKIGMILNSSNKDFIWTPAFQTSIKKNPDDLIAGESHFDIDKFPEEFNKVLFKTTNKHQENITQHQKNKVNNQDLPLSKIPIPSIQAQKPIGDKKTNNNTRSPKKTAIVNKSAFIWKIILSIICLILILFFTGFWIHLKFKQFEHNQVLINKLHENLSQTINQTDIGKLIAVYIAQQIDTPEINSNEITIMIASIIASKVVIPQIEKHEIVNAIAKKNDLKIDKQYFTKLVSEKILSLNLENVYIVKNEKTWLRSHPNNLMRDRIVKLKHNEFVRRMDKQSANGFYQIIATGNKTGWVHSSSVVKINNLHLLLSQ